MQNRRKFLRQAGLGLVSLAIPAGGLSALAPLPATRLDDEGEEAYWSRIKSLFPVSGADHVYMNNGTMGPSPQAVIDAQIDRMKYVNKVALYGGGEQEALDALARFLNAGTDELALTHNVTEGLNIIAVGLRLKAGDEVVITDQEHVGHGLPWLNKARLEGVVLKVISPAQTAEETMRRIEEACGPRTRVIAIPHILCTTGQVMPVKEMALFARERNIYSVVDGAHAPGMIKVDLQDINCDFYASCCHKWMLGPKGTGFVYIKKARLQEHESYYAGAHTGKDWVLNTLEQRFDGLADSAHRYFYGTQSSILYFGVEAAVRFQEEIGIEQIETRVRKLADYLYQRLTSDENIKDKVTVLTPLEQKSRAGIVSFRINDSDNQKFYEFARKNRLVLRFVPESGLDCIRASTHIYNTPDDVDQLIRLLHEWSSKD